MFPTGTIVAIVTEDRLREADTARLARRIDEQPPKRRRTRRIRTAATRLAFSVLR